MRRGVVIAIGQISPAAAGRMMLLLSRPTFVLPLPYRIRWTLRTDRAFMLLAWCNNGRASFNSLTACTCFGT
jgi:hypothetical protein